MGSEISFYILTNTNNSTKLRKEVEIFLYENFVTTTEGADILTISVHDNMPYRGKYYKIQDSFYVYLGQYALQDFYDYNYYVFKNGLKITQDTTIYPNFVISIECFFLENGTEKFALQLADKLLDLTNGYLANSRVSNFLINKYLNEILPVIDHELDQDRLLLHELYLFTPDLVKRILSQDLLIDLEPDWIVGEVC